METIVYPKVLIIGVVFNSHSGPGITLSNLFKDWPIENLAVASENIENINFQLCNNIYQLGYNENKRKFPFGLLQRKRSSGIIKETNFNFTPTIKLKLVSRFILSVQNTYSNFLHFFGLFHYCRNLKLTKELSIWIQNFKPDIIYSHANSLEIIKLVLNIQMQTGASIVTHIMDDYPNNYFNPPGLAFYKQKSSIQKLFLSLFNNSALCLAISNSMAEAYQKQYGVSFYTFHNVIDWQFWNYKDENKANSKNSYNLLYAGRIGIGIDKCLMDVANAINILPLLDMPVKFQIQVTNEHPILKKLLKFNFVEILPMKKYEDLPKQFAMADILVLPNNFDEKSINYLMLSMPNKAPEYMASGTPILVYASNRTAVSKYAEEEKWGAVVCERNVFLLRDTIFKLINDVEWGNQLGAQAKAIAKNRFDSEVNRLLFLKHLVQIKSNS